MSYAIANIIYGVPLTEEVSDLMNKWEQDETNDNWFESNDGQCGFTTLYSGSAPQTIGFCGVLLGTLKEFKLYESLSKINTQPTALQIAKTTEKISKLHPEIKALLPDVDVYLVWSTS